MNVLVDRSLISTAAKPKDHSPDGTTRETKHLVVSNDERSYLRHGVYTSGCGTSNYGFIWGMAGENFIYTDMDPVNINDLR